MGKGHHYGCGNFLKTVEIYEEVFTDRADKICEDPPIVVKEGSHRVFVERTEEDQNVEGKPLMYDVTTCLVKGSDGPPGVLVSYENKYEIDKLRNRLSHLENMSAIGELAASAVHEIKNPIFSIRGFLQLLESSFDKDDKRREYTYIIVSELDRLSKLIDEILILSKERKTIKDSVSVEPILRDAIKLFKPRFDLQKVTCHFKVAPDIPPVLIDFNQLKQVFINIIQNALDAMPSGGNVYLEAFFEDGKVIIQIKDEGPGIKRENMNHMFKPFFTTKEKGTGLGLYISKRIISNYGGDIRFKSEEGLGTTFIIELPGTS